jgi:hypothetical protein
MDTMQEWEVANFYDYINWSGYHTWEQTRLLLSCYVDHKKVSKITDIMRFAWDEKDPNEQYDELSEKDKESLRQKQREYLVKMAKDVFKKKDTD